MKQMPITGIILAGGKSSRMNTDKARLSYGGSSLLETVADKLTQVCAGLLIVTGENSYEIPQALQVADLVPGYGPLGGIYTGLFYTKTNYNMIVACDMPNISPSLIRVLTKQAQGFQAAVPCRNGYYEPLAAVYHKNCLPVFEQAVKEGVRKITACYPRLKVKVVADELFIDQRGPKDPFVNLNTTEEWEQYCRASDTNKQE